MRMMLVLCNSNYPSDHNFENGQYSTDQLFRCGPGPGESGFVINGYGSNTGNGCRHMLAHPSCCHQREREWRKERKRIEESERVEKEKLWAVSRRLKLGLSTYFIIFPILRCDSSSMADYGLDGLSSTMSELHYGSRASSPGGSVLRDYRWVDTTCIISLE